MELPVAFCWTKVGTEAGEAVEHIVGRKEGEREQGDGTFLWGIGNSVWPSLAMLVCRDPSPSVVFSPMLSAPAPKDVRPTRVVRWRAAVGANGDPFSMPPASLVTSRLGSGWRSGRHYALVCHSDGPLSWGNEPSGATINDASLRNLRTGARLGSSQVTSVVARQPGSGPGRYQIAMRVSLISPYLVVLGDAESYEPDAVSDENRYASSWK